MRLLALNPQNSKSCVENIISAIKSGLTVVVFGLLVQTIIALTCPSQAEASVLLSNPGSQVYAEEQSYTLDINAAANARIFVNGMPPGMQWDEVERRFKFRPDFIQGGKSWLVTMEAVEGINTHAESFMVTVNNTIQPPWPTVVKEEYFSFPKMTKYTLTQVTDNFLDSPGYAGREFTSTMVVPDAASTENLLPLGISLHGFGGSAGTGGGRELFAISPHDSNNTWWTGYNDQFPGGDASQGSVPNYTQRRVMHLLSYLVEHYPGVDLDRVTIGGQSMGGTGAHFIAQRYARHFTSLFSRIGGTAAQLLSGGQQGMLRNHWGSGDPGLLDDLGSSVWDAYDASRGLLNDHDYRNLHFSTVVGQNDNTINFRHIVGQSPVTNISFIDALQQEAVSHFIVWDQRAHGGTEGPPLSANWWQPLDSNSTLVRNQAFPVFTNSSADESPGVPDGQGGFTGSLRGVINRYLGWDSAAMIDTRDQLSIPIRVDIDTTGTPPEPGFPPRDNEYYGPLPITASVTMRRIQQFQVLPGEIINWSYNGDSGTVMANTDGSITIPNLTMMSAYTELKLHRVMNDQLFVDGFEQQ